MPLISLICPSCGHTDEELLKATGQYPPCPKCGTTLKQNFGGKCYVNVNKSSTNCTGNCATCKGCK